MLFAGDEGRKSCTLGNRGSSFAWLILNLWPQRTQSVLCKRQFWEGSALPWPVWGCGMEPGGSFLPLLQSSLWLHRGSFPLWVLDSLSFKIQILLVKPNVQRVYVIAFGLVGWLHFFPCLTSWSKRSCSALLPNTFFFPFFSLAPFVLMSPCPDF